MSALGALACSDDGAGSNGSAGAAQVGGSGGALAGASGAPSSAGRAPGTPAGGGMGMAGAALSAGSAGVPSTGVAGSTTSGGAAAGGASGRPISAGASGQATLAGSTSGGKAGAATGGASGSSAGGVPAGGSGGALAAGVVDLFNGKDLTGFTAYREKSTTLTPAQAAEIFKVEDGAIRVYGDFADKSTQARHTLVTNTSYGKYNFWMEYRWGTKTFAPYADTTRYPRDAGILFHLHGAKTEVWPPSIEFQIKDGTTGDLFALYARCTTLGKGGGSTFAEADAGGAMRLVDGSDAFVGHTRSANFEKADWNALEMRVDGGTAVFLVNGNVVNRVLSTMDRAGSPISSGPIALQAEHAEVFYRNIRIQVLQ